MSPSTPGRHQELDRYLLDGERLVTAVHQHWGKVAEPVGLAVVAGLAALWVDAHVPAGAGWLATVVWWVWFAIVLRAAYRVAEWRHDWFVATDKRLLLFYGFITRKVSMMPLIKVTDMSFERTVPGRLLGYGRFVMESAGQDQALREVNWVPQSDAHYRAICAEIFGMSGVGRAVDEDSLHDRWDEPQVWGVGTAVGGAGLPDPYQGWDDSRHSPVHGGHGAGTDSLYRSPDLRARDRSADTGPIPIQQRHPEDRRRSDGWADD